MNAYNVTFARLEEKGFQQDKLTIQDMGIAMFTNNFVNVLLQNLDSGMDIENVRRESVLIREKLNENGLNVWNTYYILCTDEEGIKDDSLLFIERDSTGLRKYVVRNKNDLDRILFLDNLPVNKIDNPIKIKDNIPENDILISNLYKFIEENEGAERIISEEKVNDLLDNY